MMFALDMFKNLLPFQIPQEDLLFVYDFFWVDNEVLNDSTKYILNKIYDKKLAILFWGKCNMALGSTPVDRHGGIAINNQCGRTIKAYMSALLVNDDGDINSPYSLMASATIDNGTVANVGNSGTSNYEGNQYGVCIVDFAS